MSMHDETGWTETSCEVAELIMRSDDVEPYSSLTDMSGQYGTPTIYTSWGLKPEMTRSGVEVELLRTWGPIDGEPCRHLVPAQKREEVTADG